MFRVRTNQVEKHANELIEKCSSLQMALNYASLNGGLKLVKYLVKQGAKNLNYSTQCASLCGNEKPLTIYDKTCYSFNYPKEYLKVLKYLVESGATDLTDALFVANKYNALPEVIEYLKTQIDNDKKN